MAIDVRDRKLLWGRAGNRCAFDTCRELLIERAEETGRDAVVSQEAHIVAREESGPRGESVLSTDERDSYPNLVLLCLKHHKIVDDDPTHWTVERLLEIKHLHEGWVESSLSPGEREEREYILQYATICDRWAADLDLGEWVNWTSYLLGPTPTSTNGVLSTLDLTRRWLFARAWPTTLPDIEEGFENFRKVLDALWMVAARSLERLEHGHDDLRFVPFQKRDERWHDNYEELAMMSEWVVDLIHDLVLELTRAANRVCDLIRLRIDAHFREEEGLIVVERQGGGLSFETWRPRYSDDDLEAGGFLSLERFLEDRATRDIHFGNGINAAALSKVSPLRFEDF